MQTQRDVFQVPVFTLDSQKLNQLKLSPCSSQEVKCVFDPAPYVFEDLNFQKFEELSNFHNTIKDSLEESILPCVEKTPKCKVPTTFGSSRFF